MVRGSVVLAVLGTVFVSSGAPAAATAYRQTDGRVATRPDHPSATDAPALDDLERDDPSSRRLGLIERLDAGGGASETTVDVTIAIVRSLTLAFQPALPAVARLNHGQLEDQFARARNRTLEQIRHACIVNMLLAYRGLSDQELDRYVLFVESEAGQWYMSVMNSALLAAVDVAAEATATELVTAVPQLVGDLR